MVYSPAGSSDLLLTLGYMTSKVFAFLRSSFSRRIDTIFFAKLNKPPSNVVKINKSPGDLIADLR